MRYPGDGAAWDKVTNALPERIADSIEGLWKATV